MNLEKLKLFRHYYVMVRAAVECWMRTCHRCSVSDPSVFLFLDCLLHLLHQDHSHPPQGHHALPVAVVLRGKTRTAVSEGQRLTQRWPSRNWQSSFCVFSTRIIWTCGCWSNPRQWSQSLHFSHTFVPGTWCFVICREVFCQTRVCLCRPWSGVYSWCCLSRGRSVFCQLSLRRCVNVLRLS